MVYARVPGNKAGLGYGRKKQKRAHCPSCDKKGVFSPPLNKWPTSVLLNGKYRECQYCRCTWSTQESWQHDMERAIIEKRISFI
jgi:hypothetical protein